MITIKLTRKEWMRIYTWIPGSSACASQQECEDSEHLSRKIAAYLEATACDHNIDDVGYCSKCGRGIGWSPDMYVPNG